MKTFAVALLAGLAAAVPMTDIEYKFINYVAKYGKSYATVEEYEARMENFIKIENYISKVNSEGNTHVAGHNKFSDWTEFEYSKMLGGKLETQATAVSKVSSNQTTPTPSFATGVNWVTAGAVTPVKD